MKGLFLLQISEVRSQNLVNCYCKLQRTGYNLKSKIFLFKFTSKCFYDWTLPLCCVR
jgi:hypothetical protein